MVKAGIRPLSPADQGWLVAFLTERWGSTRMVARGVLYEVTDHPGFVAVDPADADARIGLITYHIAGDQCEITLLDSVRENRGIGSALVVAVEEVARAASCTRLWLITTNDNLRALGFYQKRGFAMAALYRHALAESRKLKPEIPLIGMHNIPLRDEIEFEKRLD